MKIYAVVVRGITSDYEYCEDTLGVFSSFERAESVIVNDLHIKKVVGRYDSEFIDRLIERGIYDGNDTYVSYEGTYEVPEDSCVYDSFEIVEYVLDEPCI